MSSSSNISLRQIAFSLHWVARILSGVVLISMGGFMLVYFAGGGEADSSHVLTLTDYLGLVALVVSLSGLAFAWKWERLGALLSLGAVALGASLNPFVLSFPLVLIPISGSLFLLDAAFRQKDTL